MNWKEFIIQLKYDFRLTERDIAELSGVSQPAVNKWLKKPDSKPYPNTIRKLEEGLNIRIDDRDPDNITYKKLGKYTDLKDKIPVRMIPLLTEVYAGDPDQIDIIAEESMPFITEVPDHRYCAVRVRGNSMNTTLRDGEIVIVDFDAPIKNGDIVVVKLKDGSQYIKRYYNENYAFIKLTSDNHEYGVRLIDKNDIEVIHKVSMILTSPDERRR